MKLEDFCSLMESIAPRSLALDWDNVGLLIEPDHKEIKKVLLALDCTAETATEAAAAGADLLLTHHPQFFHGVKRIAYSDPETAAPAILLRHGIGLFSAHTNLDAAPGGVNDVLCELFSLKEVTSFTADGIGRTGVFEKPKTLQELVLDCKRLLNCTPSYTGDSQKTVQRVCIVGGGGGDFVKEASAAGADAYITGEASHHKALEAGALGLGMILCGHYETEAVVLNSLKNHLQKASNDVQYNITLREKRPLAFS